MIQRTETITASTKLVQHYRDDGSGRALIPLTDKELEIHYHFSYLKKIKSGLLHLLLGRNVVQKNWKQKKITGYGNSQTIPRIEKQ